MTPTPDWDGAILRGLLTNRPGSPAWRKAYARYRRSAHWRDFAARILQERGRECAMCPGKATQVHHRHYRDWFSEKAEDVQALCPRCHKRHHRK